MGVRFFTGYDSAEEREERSNESGLECLDDSLTVQADAKDADINVIMDRYARTGQLPVVSRLPEYGDFSGISDYRTALHAVRDAEDRFMELPAKLRARFENDPAQFVEFCSAPENRLELADMGLLAPEVADAIRKAQADAERPKGDQQEGSAGGAGAATASGNDGDSDGSGDSGARPRTRKSGGSR